MTLEKEAVVVVTAIVAGLLALIFILSGGRKLSASESVRNEATHLGSPSATYRLIGVAEIAGSVGLVVS